MEIINPIEPKKAFDNTIAEIQIAKAINVKIFLLAKIEITANIIAINPKNP
jgi:hypothetical protein